MTVPRQCAALPTLPKVMPFTFENAKKDPRLNLTPASSIRPDW